MLEGKDGVTHINIYTKGETTLGKWMSNLATTPFKVEGKTFQCLEGYWYYLGLPNIPERETLLNVNGFQAKKLGKELRGKYGHTQIEDFEVRIKKAILCKLIAYPNMLQLLSESTLPFGHYYEYNGTRVKAGFEWITEFWERLRYSLPIFQLVIPFASSTCWEQSKNITDEEEYTDFMFKEWFDNYLSQCKASDVLHTFELLKEDPNDWMKGWIEDAGINVEVDTWGTAYSKLNKYTTFDLLGYWVRWIHAGNELLFRYPVGSEGLDTCLSFLIYITDVILSERGLTKTITTNNKGGRFSNVLKSEVVSISFERLSNTPNNVLGKSDKPWL